MSSPAPLFCRPVLSLGVTRRGPWSRTLSASSLNAGGKWGHETGGGDCQQRVCEDSYGCGSWKAFAQEREGASAGHVLLTYPTWGARQLGHLCTTPVGHWLEQLLGVLDFPAFLVFFVDPQRGLQRPGRPQPNNTVTWAGCDKSGPCAIKWWG